MILSFSQAPLLERLFQLPLSPVDLIIRSVLVYAVVLALLRIAGRKQIAQMGPTELVSMLLISNAVQNSMTAGDDSLLGGMISAAVLIGFSRLITYVTFKSRAMSALIEGAPVTLVSDGAIRTDTLKKELIPEDQFRAMLRMQGVHDLANIRLVILDPEGRLVIIPTGVPIGQGGTV